MRLFIALRLPEAVTTELAALQQSLKRGANYPVTWVAAASVHLTLQFLGDVEEGRVPALLAALAAVRATQAPHPRLCLTSPGAFPSLQRPQVVWVGVGGDLAGLAHLHRLAIGATESLGFAPEARPFQAHLTLGRTRRTASPAQRTALGAAIAALPPPHPVTWVSGPPILYQSTLAPTGAIYRALEDADRGSSDDETPGNDSEVQNH
jgi:RNA 2',3'-cyclic 3'-phosphodiesterase